MQPGDTKQKGKEREPRVKCIPNVAGALLGRSDNSVLSAAPSPTELLRAHSQGAGGDHFLPALLPSHSLSFGAVCRYWDYF